MCTLAVNGYLRILRFHFNALLINNIFIVRYVTESYFYHLFRRFEYSLELISFSLIFHSCVNYNAYSRVISALRIPPAYSKKRADVFFSRYVCLQSSRSEDMFICTNYHCSLKLTFFSTKKTAHIPNRDRKPQAFYIFLCENMSIFYSYTPNT